MRRRRVRAGLRRAWALAAALALGSAPRAEIPGPFAITDISEALTRAYNDEDAQALHGLLAPALQARYTPEAVRRALTLCRVLTGDNIIYVGALSALMEIDPAEKIIHWVITDNVTAREQQCRIGASGDARPADAPVR